MWTGHLLPIIANYSQALGGIPLFGAAIGLYLKHQCHVHRCWRPSWHVDERDGHPKCRRHHPHHAPHA